MCLTLYFVDESNKILYNKLEYIINERRLICFASGGNMKVLISPSILAADFTVLGKEIARMEQAGADMLHFDVMDGVFVPNISFGLPVLKSIRGSSNLLFDVHLMICDPLAYAERFAQAGADSITFHYESQSDAQAVIRQIRSLGKRVGMSIRPGTCLSEVLPLLPQLDMLLIMTVEPGFGGQSFMEDMLEKIKAARAFASENGLSLDIQVDGGINEKTAPKAVAAGANVLVTGSYLFRSEDPARSMALLRGEK